MASCAIRDCGRPRLNGRQVLCKAHWTRQRRTGVVGGPIKTRTAKPAPEPKTYAYPPLDIMRADKDWAYGIYGLLAGAGPDGEEDLHVITIPGPPPSKARARHGNGRTYQDSKDLEHEKRTAAFLRRAISDPLPANVMLACKFYRPNQQRIDADNMLKHVCDAANGIAWADDSQVTSVTGIVEYDKGFPRTIVVIGRHVSTLRRGQGAREKECAGCAATFTVSPGRAVNAQRYCTEECKRLAVFGRKRTWEPRPCAGCGEPFAPKSDAQRFCGMACARKYGRKIPGPQKTPAACAACGTPVSSMSRGLCRACWREQICAQREGA